MRSASAQLLPPDPLMLVAALKSKTTHSVALPSARNMLLITSAASSGVRTGINYKPILQYPRVWLKTHILRLFKRKGFATLIEHWRERKAERGWYRDVYDGRVWKEFSTPSAGPIASESKSKKPRTEPLLCTPGNLAWQLNFDTFQPFKTSPYSIGVIFMVNLNLPPDVR